MNTDLFPCSSVKSVACPSLPPYTYAKLSLSFPPTKFCYKPTMGIWLPMPKVRSRLIVACLLLLLVVNPLNAQRSAIDTYAITNARIVTISGPVIERGTVVIRNGLIVAAGANVSAPPDARVIDGAGLTVYPGLIDSYTNLALPDAAPSPSPGGGGGGAFFVQQPPRPP